MNLFKRRQLLSTGKKGEHIALAFLRKTGHAIKERNYRNPFGRQLGEIDIIAWKENQYIFVEVKASLNYSRGSLMPEDRIVAEKLRKMDKIANYYIKTNNLWEESYRFDAISVIIDNQTRTSSIRHFKNIYL
jgi:putative endonuclease